MKYYVKASINVQAMNKAQSEIQSMRPDFNGVLFNNKEMLELFIEMVKGTVEAINKEYPRCKNLEFSRWQHGTNTETIGISNVLYLHIYPVNKEVPQ